MENKLVSVVLPSYNSDNEMLAEAVSSILDQSYQNLELIVIDDGSEKPVEEVLKVNDDRLRIVRNGENKGIVYSLNRGLELADGDYIARMDADDISDSRRIKTEVRYLDNHEEIDVISSYAQTFGMRKTLYKSEISTEGIMAELLWKNPIIHPTVMIRSSLIKNESVRYSADSKSEDFDLWSRIVYQYKKKIAVIPQPLLYYRIHEGQITKNKAEQLMYEERRIILGNMSAIGIELEKPEYDLYTRARNEEVATWNETKELIHVFNKVLKQIKNEKVRHVLRKRYSKELVKTLTRVF